MYLIQLIVYFNPLSLIFYTRGANDVDVFIQKKSLKNTITDRL